MRTSSIATKYSTHMRSAFKLWPTWLPGSSTAIGDYGTVESGVYVRQGNVDVPKDFCMTSAFGDHFFTSEGITKTVIQGKGGVAGSARFETEFDFGRSFGVVVALRGCSITEIVSPVEFSSLVRDELSCPTRGLAFVTSVVCSRSALIAIASGGGGKMRLSSELGVPGEIVAQLAGEVDIVQELNLGYRAVIKEPSHPLVGLSRVSSSDLLKKRGSEAGLALEAVEA